jgi:hypothetical protein
LVANEASFKETVTSEQSPVKDPTMDEDRAALLANKSYAVVTRDDPYPYFEIEEDFVQFMLERVVMMRELPYMK